MSSLIFDVLYRDHGAARGFTDLGKRVDQTSTKYAAFKRGAGIAALAIGTAVVKFGKDSVKAYSESEDAQKSLGFAFAKFPKLADTNQAALQRLNSTLQQKTRFDDDNIASGQAVLAQFKLTGRQIEQVTPLLLDYASKTGKDIPAAAQDVGKALLGNAKALKNVGIFYKSTGDASKDFTNVTALMREKVGGFANLEGETASGRLEILKNQFGELQEVAGSKLVPALSDGVAILTDAVEVAGKYGDAIIPLAVGVGGVATAVWAADKAQKAWAVSSAVTSGLAGRAVGGLNTLKVAWTGVELSSAAAGRAMRIAQLSIPVVGIALFGVTTAMAAYASKTGSGSAASGEFASAMQSVEGNVTLATAALNENVRATAAKRLQDAGAFEMANRLGIGLGVLTDAALGNEDAILQVNAAIRAGYKGTSDQVQAAGSLGRVLVTTADAARSDAQAERERRAAMQTSTGATNTAKTAAEQMADAQDGLKRATKELNTELQKSIDKMTILRDGALSVERANVNWEESLDNVRQSVKDNGKSLSEHTDKGRANRRAIVGAFEALDEKTRSDYKNAASSKDAKKATEEANVRYKENRRDLRNAAIAAGYSKEEVDKMIKKYLKTPKRIDTDIKNDAEKAQEKADHYKTLLSKIKKQVDTDVDVKFGSSGKVSLTKGGRMTYVANATGGILPGFTPGRDVHEFLSTSPGVPNLRLSGGEPILRPEVGRVVGKDWVYGVNQAARDGGEAGVKRYLGAAHGGPTRAFAGGGVVPSMGRATNAWKPARAAGRIVAANAAAAVNAAAVALLKEAAAKAAAAAGGGVGAIDVSNPGGRTSFRGGRFSNLAAAHLRRAEKIAGVALRVYQGGWRPRTSYSGTSHAGDAVDAQASGRVIRALRRVGWASGDRTGLGNWMSHSHSVPGPGRGYARGVAPWQYRDYRRRGGASQGLRSPWGLDSGGVMVDPSTVNVSERGPERVLTAGQNRNFERLTDAVTRNGGGAMVVHNHYNVTVNAPNYVGPQRELVKALTNLDRANALSGLAKSFAKQAGG